MHTLSSSIFSSICLTKHAILLHSHDSYAALSPRIVPSARFRQCDTDHFFPFGFAVEDDSARRFYDQLVKSRPLSGKPHLNLSFHNLLLIHQILHNSLIRLLNRQRARIPHLSPQGPQKTQFRLGISFFFIISQTPRADLIGQELIQAFDILVRNAAHRIMARGQRIAELDQVLQFLGLHAVGRGAGFGVVVQAGDFETDGVDEGGGVGAVGGVREVFAELGVARERLNALAEVVVVGEVDALRGTPSGELRAASGE